VSCYRQVEADGRLVTAFCYCGWTEEHSTWEAAERAASRHPAPVPVTCCTCGYQPPAEVFEQFESGEIATREDFDDRLIALHREFDGAHYENWVEVDL
jgi:hypothetical protein